MIDFNKTKQYTLSIRLSTDGFCFAVHNPQTANEYTFLPYRIDPQKSVTNNLKVAIDGTEMLKHTYGSINIILTDIPYTLVPKEYYTEQYERELYQHNTSITVENSIIMHNVIDNGQAVVLFSIEKQLHQYITTHYPKAKVYAAITPLINFGIERSYAIGKKYSLLYMRKRSFDFMCYENAAPLFVNTFHYRDVKDAMFFLLNCWTTLSLSQTEDTLHIAGATRPTKGLAKDLNNFIQHIHIIHPAEEFHSTELARTSEIPFDLQALIACE